MLRVSSAVASHPGLRRAANEDAHCVRPDLGLYLVSDGMGGHAAGEVASRTVAAAVEQCVLDTSHLGPDDTWPVPYDPALSLEGNRLAIAICLANRRLQQAMDGNGAFRGMATTVAALLIGADDGVVAHVGDSRVYRWRNGVLEQITDDHSWVGEQVRAGMLTESDARNHPLRNVVTRAITGGGDPVVDVQQLHAREGDRMLACSDGLSGVVPIEAMARILGAGQTPADVCQVLVDAANQAGGPDNITVAVLFIDVA
jgi:PPM family protein phosphatase